MNKKMGERKVIKRDSSRRNDLKLKIERERGKERERG